MRRHDAQWIGHAAGDDADGKWDGNAARHGHGRSWHDGHAQPDDAAARMTVQASEHRPQEEGRLNIIVEINLC